MGARRVMPVFTRHTNSDRVNAERLAAHCVEAAEQCGLVAVPDVLAPQTLEKVLADWPGDRGLMFCDETAVGGDAAEALRRAGGDKWGILIGPEGGFSADEITRLRALPFATPVSLGPRILRADTAAVACTDNLASDVGGLGVKYLAPLFRPSGVCGERGACSQSKKPVHLRGTGPSSLTITIGWRLI